MADGWINSYAHGIRAVVLAMTVMTLLSLASPAAALSAEPKTPKAKGGGFSLLGSSSQRKEVLANLPMNRLTPQARQRIESIAKSPTIYRRLPTQAIDCDRDMFLFLTRNSETLVGLWDLMGVTEVQTRRTGRYQLEAVDGAGTTCTVDLIYGDSNLHVFVADGQYDGKMTPRPIKGSGVFVLRSQYGRTPQGATTVTGTLDVFVQFDGLGTDLIARTLSGVIGRSADNNFTETARFIGQVSQASGSNPPAMVDVANRLPQVGEATKREFTQVITAVGARAGVQATALQQQQAAHRQHTAVRTMTRRTQ